MQPIRPLQLIVLFAAVVAGTVCEQSDHCMQSDCGICTELGDTVDQGKPGFCRTTKLGHTCTYIDKPFSDRAKYPSNHRVWKTAKFTLCDEQTPPLGEERRVLSAE
ncbi:hypothetical protein ACCO45_010947 [Purpureocillium lilacinum]|uniref:Uncharacterized protein n=1 Tax=Purpureocillium lilacinum TaxID=33203 RepID=A0ACC4DGG5_PURLI